MGITLKIWIKWMMHIIKELSIQPSQKTVHPQDYVQRSYLPYILTHLLDISWKLTGNVWQGIGWTSVMVFQIIGKSFVHSTACLGLKQRKQRRPTKDQQCGKHFDAMTSIWHVMPSLNKTKTGFRRVAYTFSRKIRPVGQWLIQSYFYWIQSISLSIWIHPLGIE